MPYLYTCPHCQTQTQVEDRYSGQAGRCVTCGGEIQLPEFAANPARSSATAARNGSRLGWFAAAAVSLILLGSLLFALFRVGGQSWSRLATNRERTSSIRNLERIASALNAYAADHGTYPPSVSRDSSGMPLHSWRVLILPYLGEDDLYGRYDLSVPWNSGSNTELATEMPSVYQHPQSASAMPFESAYYLIVGTGTLFPGSGPLGPSDVSDDPAQTILVTEGMPVIPSGFWCEPVDLDNANMQGNLGTNFGVEPGGHLDGGVAVVTVDGIGHFIPNAIRPATFRALVTPQGGERLPDDTLD